MVSPRQLWTYLKHWLNLAGKLALRVQGVNHADLTGELVWQEIQEPLTQDNQQAALYI